jgi:hypothetical protein
MHARDSGPMPQSCTRKVQKQALLRSLAPAALEASSASNHVSPAGIQPAVITESFHAVQAVSQASSDGVYRGKNPEPTDRSVSPYRCSLVDIWIPIMAEVTP